MHWLRKTEALLLREQRAVRICIARVGGSAPREAGTSMLVTNNGFYGTIGGGNLEYRAISIARSILGADNDATPLLQAFPLGADLGQCCGGNVTLLFDLLSGEADLRWIREARTAIEAGRALRMVLRVDAAGRSSREIESFALAGAEGGVSVRGTRESFEYAEQLRIVGTPLWIHGAGHVGRAVVRVLADTPFLIRWLDERTNLDPTLGHDRAADDAAPVGKQAGGASMLAIEHPQDTTAAPIIGSPGDAAALAIEHPEDAAALAATAPEGCFHLVMTHDHDLDYRIVRTLLEGGRFGWLGLIGSETKATCFRIRLAREGLADDQISRLVSPIGIDALSEAGKSPAVIAIGVAAQLLLARQATSTAQPTLGQEFEGGASTHSQSVSSLP